MSEITACVRAQQVFVLAAQAAAHVELPTVIRASTTLLSQQLWEALRDGAVKELARRP